MRTSSKLLLAGLTVALAFGAFVSASPARRIAPSSRQWRARWNKDEFVGFNGTVECHVTIEGSFHSRTIPKVLEALIGYVSRVTVDETRCTGGSARYLPETLPWHMRYNGFSGMLPEITKIHIRVVGAAYRVQKEGNSCLIVSTAASPMRLWFVVITGGVEESLRFDETAEIPLSSGNSILCGNSDRSEGTTNGLTEEAKATKITDTLVA